VLLGLKLVQRRTGACPLQRRGLRRHERASRRAQLQARDGIRRRVVDWNRAKIAELPGGGGHGHREGRALTRTEARSLLAVASDHRLGAWVVLAMTLGLRPGEVSGLSWPDVDLERGVIVVHRPLAWVGNTPIVKSTKTGKTRTLELPPWTVDVLTGHRKKQVEERLLMGDRWPAEWSDLIFVSEASTPIIHSNLRRLISTLAAEAGIEGTLDAVLAQAHRHEPLVGLGVAPELLADLLGHKDTRMVHNYYRHQVTRRSRLLGTGWRTPSEEQA
jgi:integrase